MTQARYGEETFLAEQVKANLSSMLPLALRVGEPVLDLQHDALFRRIAELRKAAFGSGKISPETLREFAASFAAHFADEEALADAANIEFLVHKQEHLKVLRVLEKASSEIEHGRLDQHSFLRYIEYWFEQHIKDFDMRFASRLAEARKTA